MLESTKKRTGLFERSPLTDLVLDRIRALAPGELLTYDELNQLVVGDVQNGERHYLRSARDIALKEGVVTDAVPNEGVRRLDDVGSVSHATGRIRRQHRHARKTQRVLGAVNPTDLDPKQRQAYDIATLVAGVTRFFTGSQYQRKVLKEANEQALPSPKKIVLESLKLFRVQ